MTTEAVRQVVTLAALVSEYTDITHRAVVALELQQEHERKQRRRRQRRLRSCWVREWLSGRQRLRHSHNYNSMESLRQNDQESFKNYTRLEPRLFDEILDRIRHRITKQDTRYREAINPGLKLAVILRHLATGNSYVDLGYSFRVGNNSISMFVPEVCKAIIDEYIDEVVPAPTTKDEWKAIAEEFQKVEMLLALVDANYRFLWADIGGVGSQSDAQIYNASEVAEVIESGEINLPDDEPLPNDHRPHPYFILSDDAFAMKSYMMKPYSRRNMTYEERIANYRISRGRRVVENAFGIMALRWQVLLTTIQQRVTTAQLIVKTCMVLHNLLRTRYPRHNQALLDQEDANGNLIPGEWQRYANMQDMEQAKGPTKESTKAKQDREYLKLYFNSPAGSVPWQHNMG